MTRRVVLVAILIALALLLRSDSAGASSPPTPERTAGGSCLRQTETLSGREERQIQLVVFAVVQLGRLSQRLDPHPEADYGQTSEGRGEQRKPSANRACSRHHGAERIERR